MRNKISLIEIDKLKAHEAVVSSRVCKLVNNIKKEVILKNPSKKYQH